MPERLRPDSLLERLLVRSYRIMLDGLPAWFLREWGPDMNATFCDRLREARADGGSMAVAAAGSREIGSVALAAFRSRVEQVTGRPHRARIAQDGSDVGGTDPVPALYYYGRTDNRPVKVAALGALACHFALFLVVFPETANTVVRVPPDEPIPLSVWEPPPRPKERPRVHEVVVREAPPVPIPFAVINQPKPVYQPRRFDETQAAPPPQADFWVTRTPSAPAPDQTRVRAGAEVERPHLIHQVDPDYPELAVRARLQCTVILEAVIGRQGRVVDAKVLRGCRLGLDEAALAAVGQWHYTPTMLNGRPVEVVATVTIHFKLTGR